MSMTVPDIKEFVNKLIAINFYLYRGKDNLTLTKKGLSGFEGKVILIVPDRNTKTDYKEYKDLSIITLNDDFNKIKGIEAPIIFDNSTLQMIFYDMIESIQVLLDENSNLRNKLKLCENKNDKEI